MRNYKIVSIILIGLLAKFISCQKEDDKLQDFYVVDIKTEVEYWDYLAFAKDGSSLLIRGSNSYPEVVYFKPEKDDDGYPIFFGNDGFPRKAVIQGYILLFKRVDNLHVDVALISPDGEIEIFRDIETGIDWSENLTKSWGGIIKWAGRGASVVGCVGGVVMAIKTVGVATPLAKYGCAAMVVSFAAQATGNLLPEAAAETVQIGVTVLGCAAGEAITCISGLSATTLWATGHAIERIEHNKALTQAADGALIGGAGDVQVTLTWNNNTDLDLHVIEPSGFEIYFGQKISPSGGSLDYDNRHGFGPENIFWPQGQAPSGTYQVFVNHFSGSQSSIYAVVINAFGHIKTYQGTIQINQKIHVANFSPSGIGLKSVSKPIHTVKKEHKDVIITIKD